MTGVPDCPPAADLADLVAGLLSGADLDRVAAHLDRCPACQTLAPRLAPSDNTVVTLCREAADPAVRPVVGRYQAVRLHAAGGLGQVHLAEDTELGRRVALKQIRPARADDPESRRRFLREAEITARLEHPGIVPVYGLVRGPDGRPHYAMRFVEGESLQEAIRTLHAAGAPRPPRGLLTRFVTVCQTIAFAHSRGVVHRDLKPANVMLGPYGETLVVDWGLAKQMHTAGDGPAGAETVDDLLDSQAGETVAGSRIGTPSFMSPEQAEGRTADVGPASDVFGLGATLYALLTGRPPGGGKTIVAPRRVNRRVPRPLDAVCRKVLAIDPADRYASAGDVGADVERWLAGEPVVAYPEGPFARAARAARRNRVTVAALAVGLLVAAVVGGGSGAWLMRTAEERQAERVRAQAKDVEAVNRAVAQVPELIRRSRFREAAAVVTQTDTGISEGAAPAVRGRLRRALDDVRLAEALDRIRLDKSIPRPADVDPGAAAAAEYQAEFERNGYDPLAGDVYDVAWRVAGSVARDALLAALDDWAWEDPDRGRRERLTNVARAADPEPWRNEFRAALAARNRPALRKLAELVSLDGADRVPPPGPAALAALAAALGLRTLEAEELLRRAQARYPADFWLNFQLATALRRDGSHPGAGALAVGFYRACLVERPDAVIVLQQLSAALRELGDTRGADLVARQASHRVPPDRDANPPGTRPPRDRSADVAPRGEAEALLARAAGRIRAEDYAEAADLARRAAALQPWSGTAHALLGTAQLEGGNTTYAETMFRWAIQFDPDVADAYVGLGRTFLRRGSPAAAADALRQAVGRDANHAPAHAYLGEALLEQGSFAEADAALRRAIRLDPKAARTHTAFGHLQYKRNDFDGAEAALRRAVDLRPGYAPAHALLGAVLEARGDPSAASAAFRLAAQLDHKAVGVQTDLARLLVDLGRFEEARAAARRAVDQTWARGERSAATDQLQKCERMIELERKLPVVLLGKAEPAGVGEYGQLAQLAAFRKYYAGSARLYEALLRKYPTPPHLVSAQQYAAAVAAVRAGCEDGVDQPPPDDAERARWRRQALAWMRAELNDLPRQKGSQPIGIHQVLRRWLAAPEFAGVRDRVADLPAVEQDDWRRFWADVTTRAGNGREMPPAVRRP